MGDGPVALHLFEQSLKIGITEQVMSNQQLHRHLSLLTMAHDEAKQVGAPTSVLDSLKVVFSESAIYQPLRRALSQPVRSLFRALAAAKLLKRAWRSLHLRPLHCDLTRAFNPGEFSIAGVEFIGRTDFNPSV